MSLVGKIWKNKEKNELNPTAFSELAQSLAIKISNDGGGLKGKLNKSSQLRKFYDTIFNLNQRVTVDNWNAILAQLHRQLALVHYAKGRKLVTDSFVRMMDELIKAVEKPSDLQVITNFLETFMAFYKECRPN